MSFFNFLPWHIKNQSVRRFATITLAILTVFAFSPNQGFAQTGDRPAPAIPPAPQELDRSNQLLETSRAGDAFLKAKQWNNAIQKFHECQAIDKYYGYAMYGLAQAYAGKGQWKEAAANFRILYSIQVDEVGTRHSHFVHEPTASMDYAITLSHLGQAEEAVSVYNKAVNKLNYQDYDSTGKPFLEVLFPTFAPDGPLYYTPKVLQSIAHTVRGYDTGDASQRGADFQEAIQLDPNSAVAYYYFARFLEPFPARRAERRAALLKASQVGSGPMLEVIRAKFKTLPKD